MRARRAQGAAQGAAPREAVVRSIGVVPERASERGAPAQREVPRFVAVDRLREHVDQVGWAPLRLSGERRARPASPRLPHALVLHLAHAARLASADGAALDAVAVRPDPDALASFLGADPDVVAGALAALRQGGILYQAAGGADAVSLAPALLGPAPRTAGLDWGDVALATAGSPSAWLAAHVLAERLAPGEWTPVPRSALEHALGCGVSGVRSAVDRLAAAAVVERREQRGGVSAYRFAPNSPASPPPVPAPAISSPAVTSPARSSPAVPLPAPAPDTGVRLTIGGVDLDVPAGLSVRIELGPDGRPRIAFAPAVPPAAPPS